MGLARPSASAQQGRGESRTDRVRKMDGHAPAELWTLRFPLPANRSWQRMLYFLSSWKKKIKSFPIFWPTGTGCQNSPASQGPSPGKELRYIITLSAFSVGAGILFSRPQTAGVTVFSLALAPGKITGMLTTRETGAARSECRAVLAVAVRSAPPSQDGYRWERKWGFPSSLNSVMVFAPPRVEK